MQRLQLSPDEEITRKEYLKRKKKQSNGLKKRSKITYIIIGVIVLLSIYVLAQFYVYGKSNNFKYLAGEEVGNQKVYNTYYVTEGYTYDPVYSLNSIRSDGFDEKSIYSNSGLVNIQVDEGYLYGIKEEGLYRIKKGTNEMETLVEKNVLKYKLMGDKIYYLSKSDKALHFVVIADKTIKNYPISEVSEFLIDENNLYVVQNEKTKKVLVKFDKNGENKQVLTSDSNVSYMIQDESTIYFVNKKDGNKIYSIKKDGSGLGKIDDVASISDKGEIKEVDGQKYMFIDGNELFFINVEDSNTLWKINLETKEKEKVISVSVEILQSVDKTVFYKVKNEMGIYLYNYETKFMSQVTKRKLKEFVVDSYSKVDQTVENKNSLQKN